MSYNTVPFDASSLLDKVITGVTFDSEEGLTLRLKGGRLLKLMDATRRERIFMLIPKEEREMGGKL